MNSDEQHAALSAGLMQGSPEDLFDFVADLRRLTRLKELSENEWSRRFQLGMRVALARKLWLAAAELAHVALGRHEANGQMRQFIDEMGWAVAIASDDPDALLYLSSLRGAAESTLGDFDAAKASLERARTFLTSTTSPRAVWRLTADGMVVGLKSLSPWQSDAELRGFLTDGDEDGMLSGLVASWYIRFLVACGRDDDAQRWAPWLGERSVEESRPWQAAEAQVFAQTLGGDIERPQSMNPRFYTATWMLAVSRLRSALLSNTRSQIVQRLSGVGEIAEQVVPATRDGAEAYAALGSIYLNGTTDTVAQPSHLSLQNLGSALAALEAVALAGSDEQVVQWLEWYDATWPDHIVTSLEWRASAPRLRGLLLLRLGRLDEALVCLDAAIAQPVSVIEGDIAELQRFELTDPGHPRRAVIWERLAVAGVAPHLQAYAVLSALRRSERASAPEREGASEVERRR